MMSARQTLMLFLLTLMACSVCESANRGKGEVKAIGKDLQSKIISLNPEYVFFSPQGRVSGKLPLVIYLHGAGGRGNDLRGPRNQAGALLRYMKKHIKKPFLLVAPQCLRTGKNGEKGTWQLEDLNCFLEDVKSNFAVDNERIYLLGNSMGGYGTWLWGGNNPEHFAAIAPISGGLGSSGPKGITSNLDEWAKNLAKIPVYAFVGGRDRCVPPDRSRQMINAIREAGGKKAKLKVFPKEGHGAGRKVYSSPELFEWMFRHKRN